HVFLARALRDGLRLLLRPTERQARDCRQRVDEQRVDLIEVFQSATDCLVMRLAIAGGRREALVRSADPAGKIACSPPIIHPNGRHRQIEHTQVAGLDIDEQRPRRIERSQQAGLADADWTDNQYFCAPLFSEARICRDNFHCASPSTISLITCSITTVPSTIS